MNRSQSRDNLLNTPPIIPESLYVQQLKSKIQKLEISNSNYNELYNKHNSLMNEYNILEKEKQRIEQAGGKVYKNTTSALAFKMPWRIDPGKLSVIIFYK